MSGIWIPDSIDCWWNSGFLELNSGFQSTGFLIFPYSGIRITLHGAINRSFMFSLTDATEQLAFLVLSSYSSSDVNQCWCERPDPLCIYQSFAHLVDWLLLRWSREHERANWRHSNGRSVHQRQTPRCRPEVRCWSRLRSLSSSVVYQPTWGIL